MITLHLVAKFFKKLPTPKKEKKKKKNNPAFGLTNHAYHSLSGKQGRIPGGFSSRFQVITIDDVSPSPPPLPSRRAHQDEAITGDVFSLSIPMRGITEDRYFFFI